MAAMNPGRTLEYQWDRDQNATIYRTSTRDPDPAKPGDKLRTERHCCPVCRGNRYDRHGKPCWRC